jgi:hypothetical protein
VNLFCKRRPHVSARLFTLGTERSSERGRHERQHGSPLEIAQPAMARMMDSAEDHRRQINPSRRRLRLAVICSMMLLGGCVGPLRGDASAGPNPGGGFYGAPNINIGRINP